MPVRVINAIKELDSKGMLKFGLNKGKKKTIRISLSQCISLADIIAFSHACSLLAVGCQHCKGAKGL